MSLPSTPPSRDLSSTVRYVRHGSAAVIFLDNPPVNGLGDTVRQGIHAGLALACADAGIDAIVITGAGKAFCGGADIRQFNTPAATARRGRRPTLRSREGERRLGDGLRRRMRHAKADHGRHDRRGGEQSKLAHLSPHSR